MARYIQRTDGEGWSQRAGEVFRVACCDCGLVHDMAVVIGDGEETGTVGIAAKRNERATAARRRRHKKQETRP